MNFNGISVVARSVIFSTVLFGVICCLGQYISAQVAGPGRIIFTTGNSYSQSFDMTNKDGTNTVNLTDLGSGQISMPSASIQTGMVAFQAKNIQISPAPSGQRIFVMNADGSGVRQVTFPDASNADDYNPVISSDGTKIAFISKRAAHPIQCVYRPDGQTYTVSTNAEVFTINTDGTNLQQLTTPELDYNCDVSDNYAVAWSSGGQLAILGTRPYTFQHRFYPEDGAHVKSMFNVVSVGNSPIVYNFTQSADPALIEPVATERVSSGFIDWGTGSNIIFHADWGDPFSANYENSGSIGSVSPGGGLGAASHTLAQSLVGVVGWNGSTDGNPHGGDIFSDAGGVRYSPDGQHLLFYGRSPLTGDENARFAFVDNGGGSIRSSQGSLNGYGLAWAPGAHIPTPSKLVLAPNPALIHNGETVRIVPTLIDAQGNVIVRAALWRDHFGSCPTCGFICDPQHSCSYGVNFNVDFTGAVTGNAAIGTQFLCASNAGLVECGLIGNNMSAVTFAEINASVPSAKTNGVGGDGVFTIRRQSDPPNTPVAVDFTTGGSAVRDLDYTLNVSGNTVTIPAGQSTFDLHVTPLRAAGDKSVSLSITAPPHGSYVTIPGRDAATVNILDNGSAVGPLSLSSITTSHGGNGGVVGPTVYGSNIDQSATIKLTRAGQPDIPGANARTAVGGKSITTIFDLNGALPGSWNVVVTNPDSSTKQLVNAFQVEPNSPTRLTVQISGANEISASHYRSNYDVIYTNHGNTDAFGVVIFITGVAPNECATSADPNCTFLDTPLADIPDVPGQAPFPAWVRQVPRIVPADLPNVIGPGIRHVGTIPVLIPRIPANTSATFRFSLRYSGVNQTVLQKLNAAILPPLVTAVTVSGAGRPTVEMRPNTSDEANSARDCLDSILLNAINCALGFVPLEPCLRAGLAALQTLAQTVANFSVQGNASITPFSGAQFYAAGLSAMTCLESATPIGLVLNVIGCMAGVYDSCATCLGPDACNPFSLHFVQSSDPNEKAGVKRFTSQNYVRSENLLYGISFENRPDASAPAQEVVITDQLDTSKIDTSTLELGQISFGDTVINVPTGMKTFSTEVDLRPANDLLVDIGVSLDQKTGILTWRFTSLDPFTRQPPTNALAGFLPPNIGGTEGAGKVLFTISPNASVSTFDEIRNKASIIFDLNPPIVTNEWLNTIDNSTPSSQVNALLPTQNALTFPVTWSGSDTGSGIADFSVFVSDNGGPSTIWQNKTSANTAQYTGQIGHTYSFYSVAEDNAANLESVPTIPDTTTLVLGPTAAAVTVSGRVLSSDGREIRNARVTITDNEGVTQAAITGPSGQYLLEDVESGRTYVVAVAARRFRFSSQVIQVLDNVSGFDFVAESLAK